MLHVLTDYPAFNKGWRATAAAVLENVPYGSIRHRIVAGASGEPLYDCPQLIGPGGVAILPVTSSGQVGLVFAARPGMLKPSPLGDYPDYRVPEDFGRLVWEAPRGYREPGEEAGAAAHRELAEEVGLTVSELVSVGEVNGDSAILAVPITLFLARCADGIIGRSQHSEGLLKFQFLPIAKVQQLVSRGDLVCAVTLALLVHATWAGWLPLPTATTAAVRD
jgi:8-oxo-dGTP pyrophosphatase MutT (NUDIX family)